MTAAALHKSDQDLTQIINGEKIMAPSPFGIHQKVLQKLSFTLQSYLVKNPIGELFPAPLDVILEEGFNHLQPDLIFIQNKNMGIFQEQGWIHGVPDLLIEIISKGTFTRDTEEKFEIYQRYGVSEYWLVFPELQCIEVFTLENTLYSLYCSTERTGGKVFSKVFKDLEIDSKATFG